MQGRSRLILVLVLLTGPALLAGCLENDPGTNIDYKEGHGLVTIYVARPIDADKYPLRELTAVPRTVVFIAGSNETKTEQGEGFVDAAVGWSRQHLSASAANDTWPPAAEQNWLLGQSIWYRGQVPAGEFSVIRIEVINVDISYRTGGAATASVQSGRLSASPGDGSEYFVVQEGKELVVVLSSRMEEQSVDRYVIR